MASGRFLRAFGWFSGLLFVTGAIAFTVTRLAENPAPATNTITYDPDFQLPDTAPQWTAKDVPRAAQKVAGEFILAAVGREDLAKAWALTHPELKQGMTRKEWLTGDIPVQFYPSEALDAAYTVDELDADHVVLTVALVPKEGSSVKPQAFFIGLKKGAGDRWLVNYWAPRSTIPVPAVSESG